MRLLEKRRKSEKGTSFLGQIEIGGPSGRRKEGRRGRWRSRVPSMGAKPHFRRAIHTGRRSVLGFSPVRISFRLDEVGLAGRRWSTGPPGWSERRGEEGGERRGMQKGRGPGVCRVLQIIQLAPRIKVCIFIALRYRVPVLYTAVRGYIHRA